MMNKTFLAAVVFMVFTCSLLLLAAVSEIDGQKVFDGAKCGTCHSVTSAGIEAKMKSGPMAGSDLTGIGEKHEAKWIASYLRQEVKMDGKAHAKAFKGSDEELQALVDWLLEQKSE
ncbi:MAG TPA: c-type cytochrome [Acidobacteriota bacterium]|nr:c-type cytochrome [Acidobacteriota bacterium]